MIKIANAPCSWGVLEFDISGKTAGYNQVLDEIQETGYTGTELGDWGFMPVNPVDLSKELNKRELTLVGAFVPVFLKDRSYHNPGMEVALRTAELMAKSGAENAFLILADENGRVKERTQNAGRISPEMGLTSDEWLTFADGANRIAQEVKKQSGLRTTFHHHCAGYIETPEEIEIFLSLTDPGLIGLVLDMGHYTFGGGDPVEALTKYKERIWHVHFKDCSLEVTEKSILKGYDYFQSVNAGIFCELGKGIVDFPAIVKELKTQNYNEWIVVEQDVLPGMGDPKACALRNREYIRTLGL